MNAYTWMMAVVLGLALLLRGNKRNHKVFIVMAVLIMFFIMGFRDADTIGNDSRTSYKWEYNSMDDQEWRDLPKWTDFENNPGLPYFMKTVRAVTGASYQTFIIIESAIIMFAFYHLIQRYSISPIQSICYYWGLLLYLFMFSAIKQALAMSILIFAFDAIMEKRPIKFIIMVIVAAWFHFPALIFLPAYWIAQIKVSRLFLLVLLVALGLTYLFRNQIINLMMIAYGEEESNITLEGVKFIGNKVIIMLFLIVVSIVLRPITSGDYLYGTLLKFVGIATVFQTFCYYNNIFERLADYYFQFAVILLPLVFEKSDQIPIRLAPQTDKMVKTAVPVLSCAFCVWRFAAYIAQDWHFVPYRFFFQ